MKRLLLALCALLFLPLSAWSGVLYIDGPGSHNLIRYNFDTDRLNPVWPVHYDYGLAYDPHVDSLYGLSGAGTILNTIDRRTGQSLTSVVLSSNVSGLTFDLSNNQFYSSLGPNGDRAIYTVDQNSGIVTLVGNTGAAEWIVDLSMATNGQMYGVGANGGLYQINKTTGQAQKMFDDVTANLHHLGISGFGAFAINENDEMFGVTFAGDRIVQIDPSLGTTTIISYINAYEYNARGMTFAPHFKTPVLPAVAHLLFGFLVLLFFRRVYTLQSGTRKTYSFLN